MPPRRFEPPTHTRTRNPQGPTAPLPAPTSRTPASMKSHGGERGFNAPARRGFVNITPRGGACPRAKRAPVKMVGA